MVKNKSGRAVKKLVQTKKFRYFAYGSNMLDERLKDPIRCPSSKKIKPSTGSQHLLKGWKFSFSKSSRDKSGKGNIVETRKKGDKVYGVIFEIKYSEKDELDCAEKGYDDYEITILDEKNSRKNCEKVIVYYKKNPGRSKIPYDWYKEYIVEGAKKHNLPKRYIKELKKNEEKEDKDPLHQHHAVTQKWLEKCGYKKKKWYLKYLKYHLRA